MLFGFQDITYSLGIREARQVCISGSVDDGEVLVVRGPSGAGKSTLLRILARLQPCLKGEAFLHEESWSQFPGTAWRARVHYLSQRPVLFDGTVRQNLAKPFETDWMKKHKTFDLNLAKQLHRELRLSPDLWEQDARTLSGGEAARLAFIRALLVDPVVLLLDEPTAALDEKAGEAFYGVLDQWLSAGGRAAVLISHNNDYERLKQISFVDVSG